MSDPIRDRIEVTFDTTADEYARCFAVRAKHESAWANFGVFVALLFTAIPVALLFRFFGTHLSASSTGADLIGQFSLASFLLGTIATVIAGSCGRRTAINRYLAGTPNAFGSKTAVFDATGVALIGQISQTMWQWAAVSRLSCEKQLLLI